MTTRPALAPAVVLFCIMAAHGLLETARDALFLVHLGPNQLAWAYLAIAVTALGAVAAVRKFRVASEPRSTLIGFLIVATVGTGVLAATLMVSSSIVFVLYVWTGLVATLLVPCFWMVVDRSVRLADAKKSFAAIGAGGVLGALVGSALAAGLAQLVAPQHLVTAAACMLALTTVAASVLAPYGSQLPLARSVPKRLDRSKETHRTLRYLRLMLIGGMLGTVALTLADLMFKRVLAEGLAADELATALGAAYTGFNLLALVVQLFVTRRLIERLGVGGAMSVLPLLVLATALGFAISGAVVAVLVLKLADGGFRHSVHRVASEILFMPLTSAVRDAAKPVIDVIGQRGGQVCAALLTLLVSSGADGTRVLGLLVVSVAALWLIAMALTRNAYVQQFRDTIDAREIQRNVRIATLDADGVAMLTASLSSPDESEALAALDLLARRGHRVPALVLYHPSAVVVRRALSLLQGDLRHDAERVLGHLTEHPDPQIRAAALAASSRTGCHHQRLTSALGDPEPAVRAAAIVGLSVGAEPAPALATMLAGTVEERIAAAQAIGRAPHERFRGALDALVAGTDAAVLREVLAVWERAPQLANVQRLLRLLENPRVRGDARRVFVAAGPRLLADLFLALDDPRTPIGVRRHLPRTISQFGSVAAAAALVSRLIREPDGMTEFKILRALGRMRADAPALAIDAEPVRVYVRRATEDATRYARLSEQLAASHPDDTLDAAAVLLGELLVEKRDAAVERVFRAIGVLHPRADLRSVHDALVSGDEERSTAAREILEDLLPASIWVPLLEVLDPMSSSSARVPRTYPEVLAAILDDPSDSLRCVAAHHIAQRRLVALRSELVRLRPSSPLVCQAFTQAIARLDA